jgi:O-antigen/teichoic acid export membrane protein
MAEHSRGLGFRQYFLNIAWSWLGAAAMLVASVVVTPLLIRRLGTERFGIWALALSMVEYLWMIDLGLRPATVKLSAELRASGRWDDLNRVLSTALAYSSIAGAIVLLLLWPNAERIGGWLRIHDPQFAFLTRMVSVSWAFGLVFNTFAAMLEGFQRFDITNRIGILLALARSGISLALVLAGYGLREMGIVLVVTQMTSYLLLYLSARGVYPQMRVSPARVSRERAGSLAGLASQMVGGMVAGRITQASLPSLIAYFLGTRYVTYFTQTQRIFDYSADVISRVGMVSAPRAAHLDAEKRADEIVELTRNANRYCLTVWGALGSFLFVYGGSFCRLWVNEEFGRNVEILMPALGAGYLFFMSQFVSAAVLMGIGRYHEYSLALFTEALLTVAVFAALLPWFGLTTAAIGESVLFCVVRCGYLSWLFAHKFGIRQWDMLRPVMRPFALVAASIAFLLVCRLYWITGASVLQIAMMAALHFSLYGAAAWWVVLPAEHRKYVLAKARAVWSKR